MQSQTKRKYYAGIGSRKTPQNILNAMKDIASKLESNGYILRSGGADGADKAFESGVSDNNNKEIFYARDANFKASKIASQFHPWWDNCSDYAKKLHSRNVFQVLGRDLKSWSKFVICWTPDGCKTHSERSIKTGGTGTAISVASTYGIPVFNLSVKDDYDRLIKFINDIKKPV